jgi:DNA-directed RNA polymerase specialized sigma24 family protein
MVSLRVQIDEWANSDLGAHTMEFARKQHLEDALQDTLTRWLKKEGELLSRYEDIRALNAVIQKAMVNRRNDIYKRDSKRGRWEARYWEERWRAPSLPAKTSHSTAKGDRHQAKEEIPQDKEKHRQDEEKHREEERRQKERSQEFARSLYLEMFERLEPLEQITILVNREISGHYISSDISQTLATDPEMFGQIQAAASRLEPPVPESAVCTWRCLEDVARSLGCPSTTLRTRRRRAFLKLQRFLEDRGISFENWNAFAVDD